MQDTEEKASTRVAGNDNVVDIYAGDSTNTIAAGVISKDGSGIGITDGDNNWIVAEDKDGDQKSDFGDLLYVDQNGDDVPDNFPPTATGNEDIECTDTDGGTARSPDDDDADKDKEFDGTLCDAKIEFDTSAIFVDGLGLGCSETVEFAVTCTWDADGGAVVASDGTTRSASPPFQNDNASTTAANILGNSKHAYLNCSVE